MYSKTGTKDPSCPSISLERDHENRNLAEAVATKKYKGSRGDEAKIIINPVSGVAGHQTLYK